MPDPDLDALDALLKQATPREWRVTDDRDYTACSEIGTDRDDGYLIARFVHKPDAALIAAAVNALPKLIAEIRELRLQAQADMARADWQESERG